jgi:hypothetical protein
VSVRLVVCLLMTSCAVDLLFPADGVTDSDGGTFDGGRIDGGCGACPASFSRCEMGRCVECLLNSECPGNGLCDVQTRRCVLSCAIGGDAVCDRTLYPRRCSDDFGPPICAQCKEAGDCSSGVCALSRGACVECVVDGQCPASKPRCDVSPGVCVP